MRRKHMFQILIAEDEEIERNSLVSILKDSILEIGEIYSAKDGQEAIDLYQRYEPDIVILDINMPVYSDLECARIIKNISQKNVSFIILTSYDYFSYAQEAIRLGVEDFLLKPSTPQMIIHSVAKVLDRLKSEKSRYYETSELLKKVDNMRSSLENECVQQILSNQSELVIQKTLNLLHMSVKNGLCIVIDGIRLAKSKQETLTNQIGDLGLFCLLGYRNAQLILFLLSYQNITEENLKQIADLMEKYQFFDYPIGLGTLKDHLEGLYHSYCHALQQLTHMKKSEFTLRNKEMVQRELQADSTQWIKKMLPAIEQHDDEKIKSILHDYASYLHSFPARQINEQVAEFIVGVLEAEQKLHDIYIDKKDVEIRKINDTDKYYNLEINLVYAIAMIRNCVKNLLYQNNSYLVRQALEYIENNYNKAISLNDVATQLKVTPFYISKLLNKQVGKTFTDIVNEFRIAKAKQLLKDGAMAKEVAAQIGFQSSSYFAKTFKKNVGITPIEYRDMFIE